MIHPPCRAIGLMSGTSLDGVDAALIETDGERVSAFGPSLTYPWPEGFREELRAVLGTAGDTDQTLRTEQILTEIHARAVSALLEKTNLVAGDIGVVGFHGQTILHRPQQRLTRQLGDGSLLAALTGIPVVFDFRSADVMAGGQGAPLAPVYHRALLEPATDVVAVLNIGGVANITVISPHGDLVAFDTGPGNALLDDWALRHTGTPVDTDGALAQAGVVDNNTLATLLATPWFQKPPPKSLDRDDFAAITRCITLLGPADGAATLAAFTIESIRLAQRWIPSPPSRWLVCGGGRHNPVLMSGLRAALGSVDPVEAIGWNGDALEAQAFAFLAVRHLRDLPQSFPGTTGCPHPMTGGLLATAPNVKNPAVLQTRRGS